jgi:hypothetical protein
LNTLAHLVDLPHPVQIAKRQHVGTDDFALRRPQNGFTLERDTVTSQLPSDTPSSLILLAMQCCEYEAANRPFSEDVQGPLSPLSRPHKPSIRLAC